MKPTAVVEQLLTESDALPVVWNSDDKARAFDQIQAWLVENGYVSASPMPSEVAGTSIGLFVRTENQAEQIKDLQRQLA